MLNLIDRMAHSRGFNLLVGVAFALFSLIGYHYGGEAFITEWAGAVASAIAIFCLIFKTQGYWFWSIVNAGLWIVLFWRFDLPMLSGLQLMFIFMSLFGLYMWATEHTRFGYDCTKWVHNLGTVFGLGVLGYTAYAYSNQPGYSFTSWWYVEFFAVLISIVAFWMDAFKYKTNWIL